MKVAYVTTYDASDVHNWSGSGYYIAKALADAGIEIEYIGNLSERYSLFWKAKTYLYRKLTSQRYFREREPAVLHSYARQVSQALRQSRADVVFSPGSIPIAYLETDRPIVFWGDATFAGMIGFYPEFTNVCAESLVHGRQMEQSILTRCSLGIYASEWAAESATNNYDVDADKIKVVPFGANNECRRTVEDIVGLVENRRATPTRLLFCGVDWNRKGGDIALGAAKILVGEGMAVELHVVGCRPPYEVPDFVKVHGFVSKRTESGTRVLEHLFSTCHFLIVPSRAECFGMVFAEASSYGLPSLATDVGGIASAVRSGVNGELFGLDDEARAYSSYIVEILSSRPRYRELALSSFAEYRSRLNWNVAGRTAVDLMQRFCVG